MAQDKRSLRSLLTRRDLLRVGSCAVLGIGAVARGFPALAAPTACPTGRVTRRLVATDGYISLPGRDPLYVFGFREADPALGIGEATQLLKGQVHAPAPILAVDECTDLFLGMVNIGLVVRPDLDDSHTVHWHGFRNPIALFDGVPEVSIAVPVGREFPYFYRAREPGTYMYHCHFEDTEHVQMGMTGIVFIRPKQNGTDFNGFTKFVYNDGDGSTGYDREFALLLNEIDPRPHDLLEAVQEFIWSDYKAFYWVINGRAYPDTLEPNNPDGDLELQPISSLIQVNEGDRVLLRFANLGYDQHAMQLPGIPLTVVGHDATLLRNGPVDLTYVTSVVYIGPGEARDVLFTAPPHSGEPGPDVYLLRNRALHTLRNGDAPGLGGMATEVWVYPSGTLPDQTEPNETFI